MKRKMISMSFFFALFFTTMNTVYATPSWLDSDKVSCGTVGNIPAKVPELVSLFVLIAQIVVPVILVLLGMIDFAKGVMSQKEDEIKKGQQTFIKRLVMGAIVFFVVALVKILVGVVGDNTTNKENIISCIDCFINNNCDGASSDIEADEDTGLEISEI